MKNCCGYNPYYNKNKVEKKKQVEQESIFGNIKIETITTQKLQQRMKETRGHGLCFTDPCGAFGRDVLSDNESPKERMSHGKGVDTKDYYYK